MANTVSSAWMRSLTQGAAEGINISRSESFRSWKKAGGQGQLQFDPIQSGRMRKGLVLRSHNKKAGDQVAVVVNGNKKEHIGACDESVSNDVGKEEGVMRVAYQGIPGAFSEAAAAMANPGCERIPCKTYEDSIWAVESRTADRAILPVESTLEGSIVRNYDLLLHHSLQIVQEIHLFVHYCLMVMPGVTKENVRRVISHPMALAHCRHTLSRLGLDVPREAVDDTAGAAEFLHSHALRDTAAIASCRAAQIYGLHVVARGVQDESWNVTRFLVLARNGRVRSPEDAQRPLKTSIVVAHQGGLDVLLRVLSAFSDRKINLTKLEIKPQTTAPLRVLDVTGGGSVRQFEYVFYIDFEASMDDPNAQSAIQEVQGFTTFLRVLGCYAADSKVYSP
eukprot:Gb_10815 [translate_table: standard]